MFMYVFIMMLALFNKQAILYPKQGLLYSYVTSVEIFLG